MVRLMSGVLDGRINIFPFKEGVVGENLIQIRSSGKKLEDVGDTDALPTNAGAPPAFASLNCDTFEPFDGHYFLVPTFLGYDAERPAATALPP